MTCVQSHILRQSSSDMHARQVLQRGVVDGLAAPAPRP